MRQHEKSICSHIRAAGSHGISVTKRSYASPISKVDGHISHKCSCYTCIQDSFSCRHRFNLKVFRYSFSQTMIPMFFNPLKSNFILVRSPQNFHQWLTMNWSLPNAVFSKIDITMTTINKKTWNRLNPNFARSRPATENPTPGT